jgi:DNA-binding CsgD family transcriptional regulator
MRLLAEPELLEREAELAQISAMIAAASMGTGSMLVLEGAGGIGKSRLLAATREQAAEAGFTVLSARGAELERAFPFGIVRQLFEPALARSTPEELEQLTDGAATAALPVITDLGAGGLGESSFAALHGLYWLTANLAASAPVAVLVDDAHWADTPSLAWLGFLARRIDDLPALVAVAMRQNEPSAEAELLGSLAHDPAATIVQPEPLSRAATVAFLSQQTGAAPDPVFAEACREASGGNPLLLRELTRAVESAGIDPVAANAGRVLELGPEAISQAVALRLGRLDADAGRVAVAAAVFGEGTTLALVAQQTGLSPAQVAAAADRLAAVELTHAHPALAYVHPLVRRAVLATLPALELEGAHLDAARLLERAGATPEAIAAHLLAAPPVGERWAAAALIAAGRRSAGREATDATITNLRRALEEPLPGEELPGLLADLGRAEYLAAQREATEHLGRAADLESDPVMRARLRYLQGRSLSFASRPGEAIEVLDAALDELGDADANMRDHLEAGLVQAAIYERGTHHVAVEHIDRMRSGALGDGSGARQFLALCAYYDVARGEPMGPAVELARYARENIGPHGDEDGGAYWYICAALAAAEQPDATNLFDEALDEARVRGSLFTVGEALTLRSAVLLRRGELLDAEDEALGVLDAVASQGGSSSLSSDATHALGTLAWSLLEQGRTDDARAATDRGMARDDAWDSSLLIRSHCTLRELEGDRDGALRMLRELESDMLEAEHTNPALTPWRGHLAQALVAAGHGDEAAELCAEDLRVARRFGASGTIGLALRQCAMVDPGGPSIELLTESVEALEASPLRLELARSLVELGAALRRRNRRSDSRSVLRRGHEIASACGATPVAEQARQELAAGGARPRSAKRSGAASLTASERRVARLAADGLGNREIAQALFVTTKTVEVHLSSCYRKLGIGSRADLASVLDATPSP